MNYQVLARKWRPKKFQEVIGQEHITCSLLNALKRNRIGHAYLLAGTRGIGKTSIARIFAKSIRCLNREDDGNPCGRCPSCLENISTSLNIIEIDGASNNSVENVRDLINEVHYLPSTGKHKVYIIDEVHMLSTSAFNALLKTLEEPPEHVIFILATTEPQKLLGTVLSRCQRFDFRLVPNDGLVEHLKGISKREEIEFENQFLIEQICKEGRGSVRDTLSLLDQVLSFSEDKKISEEVLSVALGLARLGVIKNLVTGVLVGNIDETSKAFRTLIHENVPVKNIILPVLDSFFELIDNFENQEAVLKIVEKEALEGISKPELFWIYESLAKDASWALESIDPEKVVEILIQKLAQRRTFFDQTISKTSTNEETFKEEVEVTEAISPKLESEEEEVKEEIKEEIKKEVKEEIIEMVEAEEPQVTEEEFASFERDVTDSYSPIDSLNEDVADAAMEKEIDWGLDKSEAKPAEEVGPTTQSQKEEVFERNWDGFLKYLFKKSPALASNLEQGNIIGEALIDQNSVVVDYGFTDESSVFLEFLEEEDVLAKIFNHLESFFKLPRKSIMFRLQLVEKVEAPFVSKAEARRNQEEEENRVKSEEFVQNSIIKEAEELFSSKVDKVIFNKSSK